MYMGVGKSRFIAACMEKDMQALIITMALLTLCFVLKIVNLILPTPVHVKISFRSSFHSSIHLSIQWFDLMKFFIYLL